MISPSIKAPITFAMHTFTQTQVAEVGSGVNYFIYLNQSNAMQVDVQACLQELEEKWWIMNTE